MRLPVLFKSTNELKTGAPGRFDHHRPMASPRFGARRRRFVGDSGSPYAQGKHRPATRCHAPGRRPGSRPGPHLDQNVRAGYAAVVLALILDPSGGLFSAAARPPVSARYPLWRKLGTRKSRLETKTENEASCSPSSASLVPPTPAKPRQPRGKSHSSLQCHNWQD